MVNSTDVLITAEEAKAIVQVAAASCIRGENHYQTLIEGIETFMAEHRERFIWAPTPRGPAPTLECVYSLLGVVLTEWSFWVLESKGIHHYGQPDTGWRRYLEQVIIPTLESQLLRARNLAREEKASEVAGGMIPAVSIPPEYRDWRERLGVDPA